MMDEAGIFEALRVCYDPEAKINIVDLGRVHAIQVEPDTEAPGMEPRLHVQVWLVSRDEERDAMLAATVANRLLGIRDIARAEVHLAESPAWSPERMSPAARREWSRKQGLVQLG